jgi:hypothetical protein
VQRGGLEKATLVPKARAVIPWPMHDLFAAFAEWPAGQADLRGLASPAQKTL